MSLTLAPSIRRRGERGSVTVMTAVLMVGLVLVIGLSIDVSRIYMVRAGLQNAADAAALAAARELNSGTDGLADAVTQAKATALEANKYGLNRTGGSVPNATISKVEFSTSLAANATWYDNTNGNTVPAGTEANIRYVRVTTMLTSVTLLFSARAFNSNTNDVQATATAGMSPGLNTICDYVPLAVAKDVPSTPFATGTEFTFQFVPSGTTSLVEQDIIVLQTNGSESANLTRDSVAGLYPFCATIGSTVQTSTSNSANDNNGPTQIEVGINSRLDGYSHGMQPDDAGPDTNVHEDPTFANFNWQHYKAGSPLTPPESSHLQYAADNRRIIVMPLVYSGAIDGSVRIGGFGAFLVLRKVVNPNPSFCHDIPNPCGEVHVEYIGEGFSIGSGSYDPNGACTTLTKAVLYK